MSSSAHSIIEHMCESVDLFSAPTRAWFSHAFGRPTEVQREAWPAIRSGGNVLAIAPTGSGKTLAAFLSAIDRLMTGDEGEARAARGVRVLYVSPLKALAVDVAKNLESPLGGIAKQCEAMGVAPPSISVATRSGDTTARERRAVAAHPPDILVTTPESLYLLLTSKARRILRTVRTVIVDEVHALAGSKRGAHLALSLERLDMLVAESVQRIGLSATVNPAGEAARFLAGSAPITIIDPHGRPGMRLRVVAPLADMRDLNSADMPSKAGAAQSLRGERHISGVTPRMMRLVGRPSDGSQGVDDAAKPADHANPTGVAAGRTGSIWPVVERSVLDEILAHRTTLVFVNSRGLAERLTARLNDLYAEGRHGKSVGSPDADDDAKGDAGGYAGKGLAAHYDAVVGSTTMLVQSHDADDVIAMAHHGSVSKERRKQIEERLKHGLLRCVVATSSLELGIDMGSVDLVIQIAPPLSVSSGLQRVGRADHHVGGVSHALFYPLTREQIIGVTTGIEGMMAGAIEPLHMPRNPLDVLAQQTVAAAAMDDLKPDEWYRSVRRSAPFEDLQRDVFDAVMGMMTGAYDDEEFSAFRPPLMWNHDDDIISARPGAQRLAVTSGGTIPDRGLYTVVLPESESGRGPRRVGELDEEMVYESRVGDVITLGTSTWQIQEITRDRVVVTPAPGRTARLPFWHGEGLGRDAGFGRVRGEFLRQVCDGLEDASQGEPSDNASGPATASGRTRERSAPRFTVPVERRLREDGLDDNAVDNLAALLSAQRAATGVVPDDRHIVVERCRDEESDWRVIVHSPFGRRVHEPWALAIGDRLSRRFGFDGQIYAADDGIVIRLPDMGGDVPSHDLLVFDPDELDRIVRAQVGDSVLFAARFRECAARSLFLPRTDPGRRVPLWQQRLRAAQLLGAARTRRHFPLLLETARECLQDVYDMPALREIMEALKAGTISLIDTQTREPSPFAENLLFGFVGSVMYQYDMPQAERSAQLLSVDPAVLERLLTGADMTALLDPDAIAQVERQLASRRFWNELDEDDVAGRVARYAKTHGPFTADRMIDELGLDARTAVHALDEMERRGELLKGAFRAATKTDGSASGGQTATQSQTRKEAHTQAPGEMQLLHREVFRRIRALSLARMRKAIKPVPASVFQRFVLDRQSVASVGAQRLEGADGLAQVVEQLEGVALPAALWESAVFPARIRNYTPSMLDELLAEGDVVWVADGSHVSQGIGRIAFHPSRSAVLAPVPASNHAGDASRHRNGIGGGAAADAHELDLDVENAISDALSYASGAGSYRADRLEDMARAAWNRHRAAEHGSDGNGDDGDGTDITDITDITVDDATGEIMDDGWSHQAFENALWSLVRQGRVTNSSFAPVRAVLAGDGQTGPRTKAVRAARRRVRLGTRLPARLGGLWSLVASSSRSMPADGDEESGRRAIALVEALLDRYGVIAQPLIDKEDIDGGFSGLYPVLRRMEEHGLLVRGMFVEGFGAAQFAERESIDALRDMAGEARGGGALVAIDALDPANLYGSAIPWPIAGAESERHASGGSPTSHGAQVPTEEQTSAEERTSADAPQQRETPTSGPQSDAREHAVGLRPSRRAGSVIVMAQGGPVLMIVPRSHRLFAFDAASETLRRACGELVFALQRTMDCEGIGGITVADVNGAPVRARPQLLRMLHMAGFVPCPQGMKLYR